MLNHQTTNPAGVPASIPPEFRTAKPTSHRTPVGHAGPELKALNIHAALHTPPPAIDLVLHGLMAGSIGALIAPGGTGKTYLELQIAVAITSGIPVAGGVFSTPDRIGKVVMLAGEDGADILASRLHAIGKWLEASSCQATQQRQDVLPLEAIYAALKERLKLYPLDGSITHLMDAQRKPSAFLDQLKQLTEGARLLIIDPLRRFHDADENDSGAMTHLVQHLESVSKATGCAILLAHHTNKSATLNGNGDAQQATRGSSALTDAIRWQANLIGMSEAEAKQWGIGADERKSYLRLEVSKCNYVPPFAGVWLRRAKGGVLEKTTFNAAAKPSTGKRRTDDE